MASPPTVEIPRSLIADEDDTLLPPTSLTTPEQQTLLNDHTKLYFLGKIYRRERRRTGENIYLDHAIYCATRLIEIYTHNDALRKKYLYQFGDEHASRYSRPTFVFGAISLAGPEDLDTAIDALAKSVHEDSDPVLNLSGRALGKALRGYAQCLRMRYEREKDAEDEAGDLDLALATLNRAIETYKSLGDEGEKNVAECLYLCALLYDAKFSLTNEAEDVRTGISWAQDVLSYSDVLGPTSKIHKDATSLLASLSRDRDTLTTNQADIEKSIANTEERFLAAAPAPEDRARIHFELAGHYFALVKKTNYPGHGSEVSGHLRGCLDLTSENHPSRAERQAFKDVCVKWLSNNEATGWDWRGGPTTVEIAAQTHRIEHYNSGEDPAGLAELYHQLADMHWARYMSNEEQISDAKSAIKTMEEAARLTPHNEDNRTVIIERHSKACWFAYEAWREYDLPAYLKLALPSAREAADRCAATRSVPNSLRAKVLHEAAMILASLYDEGDSSSEEGEDDDQDDGDETLGDEAVRYAELAVELAAKDGCEANDGCDHCKQRSVYVDGLESVRRSAGRE